MHDLGAAPTSTPSPDPQPRSAGLVVPRRTFLRGAAVAAGGAVAASALAALPAVGAERWSTAALRVPRRSDAEGMTHGATAQADPTTPAGVEPIPEGWTEHDVAAREKVRRFVGSLAGPLGLTDYLGEVTGDPEYTKVPHGNVPLEPTLDGDVKVFDLTVDQMEWPIDAVLPPVKALGYNGMWPGPVLRVTEGDRVRARFTNNLPETTGVHFHGVEFDDFRQDGIPFVTQLPIKPGETYTYEFVARTSGSHMYHSHHNATDQVGRGLLGAFIVDPADEAQRPAAKYGVTQDIVFIHNDSLGGFTINGHGFPATAPIVARVGERILIRYMNEGVMMHPWHTHGFRQTIVARDGAELGTAAFKADTIGVNPGERWDAVVECDRPGVWAFHCHILPHVEGLDGMFGMVTALVVLPA